MAIDSFAKLKARLGFLANRDDLFANINIGVTEIEDAISTAIGNATKTISRDLAKRGGTGLQETVTDSLTTTANTETVALPSGIAGIKFFAVTSNPVQVLDPKDFTTLINDNASNAPGKPNAYSVVGITTAYLRPIPDSAYPLRLIWWKSLATLTDTATNPIFDNHSDLYEAAAMVEISLALEDDTALNKWRVVYEQKIDDLTQQDMLAGWAAAISGATPSVQVVIA